MVVGIDAGDVGRARPSPVGTTCRSRALMPFTALFVTLSLTWPSSAARSARRRGGERARHDPHAARQAPTSRADTGCWPEFLPRTLTRPSGILAEGNSAWCNGYSTDCACSISAAIRRHARRACSAISAPTSCASSRRRRRARGQHRARVERGQAGRRARRRRPRARRAPRRRRRRASTNSAHPERICSIRRAHRRPCGCASPRSVTTVRAPAGPHRISA